MGKPFTCRIGRRRWHAESTEDGHRFSMCRRCGVDRDEPSWYYSTTPPYGRV